MKRLFMCALLGMLMLSGCGGGGKTTGGNQVSGETARYELDPDTPAWKLDTVEDVKFTWFVNAEWYTTKFGEGLVTQVMKDDLNIDVTFIAGDDSKLSTLFASKEIPNLVTVFDRKSTVASSADTWALPLTDLADQYDPYFYKVANQQVMDWYKLKDGKTYGYPSFTATEEDVENDLLVARNAFAIRADIYEALGEPDISTPEGFLNTLDAIKANYPDIMPFGFAGLDVLDQRMQDIIGIPAETADGQWYDRNLDPEFINWMKVFAEAYRRQELAEAVFIDSWDGYNDKIATAQYGITFAVAVHSANGFQKNYDAHPEKRYIPIDGPKHSQGNSPAIAAGGLNGWSITHIANTCPDPAKAIQIYSYLLSEEGQYLTSFGVEGKSYELNADGKAELLPEVIALRDSEPERFTKEYALGQVWFFMNDVFQETRGAVEVNQIEADITKWGRGKLVARFALDSIDPAPGTQEARNWRNIEDNWETVKATMLRAGSDEEIDKIIDDYKVFLNDNGFDAIVKIRNENIKANRALLGMD